MFSSSLQRFKDKFSEPAHEKKNWTGPSPAPLSSKELKMGHITATAVRSDIEDYLSKTGIYEDFNRLCVELLSESYLPSNPYPWLINRLVAISESSYISQRSQESFDTLQGDDERLENDCRLSDAIFSRVGCDFVWGLREIVSRVDAVQMWKYRWMLHDLTPNPAIYQDYTCQVIPAVVGPTVFLRSIYNRLHSVEFRFHFVVAGNDLQEGITIFVKEIIRDVVSTEKNRLHVFLRLYVPIVNSNYVWVNNLWSSDDVVNRQDELFHMLELAVKSRKQVTAECLFSLDRDGSRYVHGQKQFRFSFVQISEKVTDEDSVIHFADLPFVTLYEGVFMRQSHVESYVTVSRKRYRKEESLFDRVEAEPGPVADRAQSEGSNRHQSSKSHSQRHRPDDDNPASRRSVDLPDNSKADSNNDEIDDEEDAAAAAAAGGRRFTDLLIDGFKPKDDVYDVDSVEVKNAIRSNWLKRLYSMDIETDTWLFLHQTLLLELLDASAARSGLLAELIRVSHSRAAHLYSLMQFNRSITELIFKYEPVNLQNIPVIVVNNMFAEYKKRLVDFFDDKKHLESTIAVYRATVLQKLNGFVESNEEGIALTIENLRVIRDLHSYLYSLYLSLLSGVLFLCPHLKNFYKSMKSSLSTIEEKQRVNVIRDDYQLHVRTSDSDPSQEVDSRISSFKHGLENENEMRRSEEVINIEMCINKSDLLFLPLDARQSILVKYVVDTRLDEAWTEFLNDHLIVARNERTQKRDPYSDLISFLRRSSIRCDVRFESTETSLSNTSSLSSFVIGGVDLNKYIHQIRYYSVYGLLSVIDILDPVSLQHALHSVSPLFQTNFRFQENCYKVAICTSVTGHTNLFGRLDPYLTDIQLHEYCFIQGPKGCAHEAIQLYIRITFEDIISKYKANYHVVHGVSFGENSRVWGVDEIIYKRKAFALQMEKSVMAREPVSLRLFVPEHWRLVPVTKRLLFRFVVDGRKESFSFYEEKHYHLYQNVFLEEDRAAFHFEFSGPPDKTDPFLGHNRRLALSHLDDDVIRASLRCDWLEVCRLLFWHSRITAKKTSAMSVELRRAMHSVARRLEYVVALGRTVGQLIRHLIAVYDHERSIESGAVRRKNITRQSPQIDNTHLELLMSQMMKSFKSKAIEICRQDASLAPRGIVVAIETKLNGLFARDEQNGRYLIPVHLKSVSVLEEILEMLSSLQQTLAYDVFHVSQATSQLFSSIKSIVPQGR